MAKLLILGGTAEARELAERAVAFPGLSVITSFAGRTSARQTPPGDVRIGGFGGVEGLADYLRARAIDMVIDATHPFAAEISANAAAACEDTNIPRLMIVRPEWPRDADDCWIDVADIAGAAAAAADHGRRIFLSVGRQELDRFADAAGLWFLARMIEPPEPPTGPAHMEIIAARGPFRLDDELRLLRDHRVDCLVSKNSGGAATHAKIIAARALGLPVIMVARPPAPEGECVADTDAALGWLVTRLQSLHLSPRT